MLVSKAYAAEQAATGGSMEMIVMLLLFGAIFYFMIYRPQNKRTKEHRDLLSGLKKNDEILMSGGIIGKILKISDDSDYIQLSLNDNSNIVIKKDYIVTILPKGTMKSL